MNTEPMIRLHLFFARDNDRAVILRQGPARLFRMILWHRDTDSFEDGQWIRNKVYVERCDLSPDGAHFLYFLMDGRWSSEARGTFTAISKPPYWTALALFPQGDTWGGGGVFLDDRHYYAFGGDDILGRAPGLSRVAPGARTKDCASGIRLMNGQRAPLDRPATRRLLAEPRPAGMWELYQRMGVPRGDAMDRYDTMGGRLFRRQGQELELIRDFTDMAFEPIRAPYDWRPETGRDTPAPWHPLKDER